MSLHGPGEKGIYRQVRLKFVSIRFNKARIIAAFGKRSQQRLKMGAIAQFTFNIRNQTLSWQIGEDALVVNFQHIGIQLGENAKNTKKRTGPILQPQPDPRQTA
jgi:hypothetical protein